MNDVFRKLQTAPSEWHASRGSGATIRRIVRSMWGYDAVTDAFTIWFGPSLIVLIGLCTALCWREFFAGLIAFAVVLVFLTTSVLLTVLYIRPANLDSNERDASLCGCLTDALDANNVITSFAAEHRECQRVANAAAAWRKAVPVTWSRFIDMGLLQHACLLLLLAGISAAMLLAWDHAEADVGDIGFAITSFLMMSSYLRNVGDHVRQLQRGLDDTSDAVAVDRLDSECIAPLVAEQPPVRGAVVFEDVSFTYPEATQAGCQNLSFSIASGEIVATIGPSGTGNSR